MTKDPPAVTARAGVGEARRFAEEAGLALVFVVDENRKLQGFLTRKALDSAPDPQMPVGKLATPVTAVLAPSDPLEKAAVLLGERYVVLPVVDGDGTLVGVLTRGDLVKALTRMAGLGEEGMRIRIRAQSAEIYRALALLGEKGLPLVSVLRGDEDDAVIHVQGVGDPQALLEELKKALGWPGDVTS